MIWKNDFNLEILNGLSKNTMVEHLGIEFTKIGENYIIATMPVDNRTVQPMRLLHGGASVALAETLGSVASAMVVDYNKYHVVGIEINANHLKSATSGMVTGRVEPVKIGGKLHIWNIEIRNESGELLCVSRLTTMVLLNKS